MVHQDLSFQIYSLPTFSFALNDKHALTRTNTHTRTHTHTHIHTNSMEIS